MTQSKQSQNSNNQIRYFQVSEEDDELIDQLYELSKKVGIRFNRQEEPFSVAVLNDVVVGGSVISMGVDAVGFSVVVDPAFQGKGIGKKLIQQVLTHAQELEMRSVYADVVNNDVLRPYLLKIGFVPDVGRLMRLELQETIMKTTKKQLEAIIRECVEKALEGMDFGDRDWLRSRQDDASAQQTTMRQAPGGGQTFMPLIQAATAAFNKIKTKGDPEATNKALTMKREVEQLAQAPQAAVNLMRARMLVTKLNMLSK